MYKKNNAIRVILIMSLCFFMLLPVNIMFAKENPTESIQNAEENDKNIALNLINALLSRQFSSLISGNDVKTEDIFYESNSTELYNQFLRWRIKQSQIMLTSWSSFEYNIQNFDYERDSEYILIKGCFDLKYKYSNGLEGGQNNINFDARIIYIGNQYLIESFDIDEVMFYDFKLALSYENVIELDIRTHKIKQINSNNIDSAIDKLLMQLEMTIELTPQETNIVEAAPLYNVMASSYSYNVANGVAYANQYVNTNNSCFYTASLDCTNFVSQCIWAAYGGWNPGDSITTMTNNINNRVRMMPSTSLSNWFGHKYGGGTPWESVEGLWNFATSNSSTGPRAYGSNNNAVYKNLVAFSISSGDVLQVKRSGDSSYGHSVYVISSNPQSSDGYHNIIVAQHTSNTTRSVADLISGWGGVNCYMRKMTFTTAQFDK